MSDSAQAGDRSTRVTRMVSALTFWLGSFPVIVAAVGLMLAWTAGLLVVPGGFHNAVYQLTLNSVTSIATFVMVFIIQSSQNRDSRALQAKLDAQNRVMCEIADRMGVEDSTDLLDLVGLEEAPEREIRDHHERLRARRPATARGDITDAGRRAG